MKLALRLQVDKQENHLHAQHKQDKASDEKAESVLHRYDISELNECDPIYQRINAVGSWRNVFEFFKPRCTFAQPREREENQRSACALKPPSYPTYRHPAEPGVGKPESDQAKKR